MSLNIPTDNTGMWGFGEYKKSCNYSSTLYLQGKVLMPLIELSGVLKHSVTIFFALSTIPFYSLCFSFQLWTQGLSKNTLQKPQNMSVFHHMHHAYMCKLHDSSLEESMLTYSKMVCVHLCIIRSCLQSLYYHHHYCNISIIKIRTFFFSIRSCWRFSHFV